ncbi:MAG TPA: hypothetical protein VF475_02940 [Sphingobium sp.]
MSSNQPSSDTGANGGKPGSPMGPGAPIALLIIAGVIVGGLLGQPSIGLLVGAALGAGVAFLAWRK